MLTGDRIGSIHIRHVLFQGRIVLRRQFNRFVITPRIMAGFIVRAARDGLLG